MPDPLTRPVAVGDRFTYTAPSGRQATYVVTEVDVLTPQGHRLPRAIADPGWRDVFITDELLAQDWWQPAGRDQSSERPADTPAHDAGDAESHGKAGRP